MGKYDTNQSNATESQSRMRFTIQDMDNFIRAHGTPILLETAMLSPVRSKNGAPKLDSPDGGMGVIFSKPVETDVMLQSMEKDFSTTDVGDVIKGTAIATTKRNDIITIRDRLTVSDTDIPQNLMIYINKKDVTHGVDLKYNVTNVLSITSTDDDGNVVDVDKGIVSGNKLQPTEDMVGRFLSIRMLVSLRFYVVDILREGRGQYENDSWQPKPNRDRTKLPTKLLLRREDMYVPDILGLSNEDGKVTEEELNTPKVNLDDNEIGGFFIGSR